MDWKSYQGVEKDNMEAFPNWDYLLAWKPLETTKRGMKKQNDAMITCGVAFGIRGTICFSHEFCQHVEQLTSDCTVQNYFVAYVNQIIAKRLEACLK